MIFRVFASPAAVVTEAVDVIARAARASLSTQPTFSIVLAGGQTPAEVYRKLREIDVDWSRWKVYWGDERCLLADDPGRNSVMARDTWLEHVAIPRDNIFVIPAHLGAELAAAEYAAVIQRENSFDLAILGVGEDGHTASLFPGLEGDATAWCVPVYHAPKPPAERISLSARAFHACRDILVIATGANKRAALTRWQAGERIPITEVTRGKAVQVLVDRAATPDFA